MDVLSFVTGLLCTTIPLLLIPFTSSAEALGFELVHRPPGLVVDSGEEVGHICGEWLRQSSPPNFHAVSSTVISLNEAANPPKRSLMKSTTAVLSVSGMKWAR